MGALAATTWPEREHHLSRAYSIAAKLHNALGLTELLATTVSQFYGRPFLVIQAQLFFEALERCITDPSVRGLPAHVGSTSQWADSTDILGYPRWFEPLRNAYRSVTN